MLKLLLKYDEVLLNLVLWPRYILCIIVLGIDTVQVTLLSILPGALMYPEILTGTDQVSTLKN